MGRLYLRPLFPLEGLRLQAHVFVHVKSGDLFMRNLSWDGVKAERHQDPPEHGLDRCALCEDDPPAPLQMFTRLGVLLTIALAFGLTAELLVRLPPH